MMPFQGYRTEDSWAILTMSNPPINGLSYELRKEIIEGVDRANADKRVTAIILTGSGKGFSGGADINEFDDLRFTTEPSLETVIASIEESPKPVIAAIDGVCLGGGLELALGCHFRLATGDARIGLPEVSLGLLPGAGGTQRLPRLIGVERALDMIASGAVREASEFQGTALFAEIVESGDLLASAMSFAQERCANGASYERVRDISIQYPNAQAFFDLSRNAIRAASAPYQAPVKCVDAVAASVAGSFDEGLALEKKLFLELLWTPESKALRHVFSSERAASKIPGILPQTPVRSIKTAAVIGAGTMGCGIAMNFANVGVPVSLLDANEDQLKRGIAQIRKNYESLAKKGRIAEAEVEQRVARIRPTMDYAALVDADISIEAVFEDMSVKEEVFRTLDRVMKPGSILATNTSTLDVNLIAAFTGRPQDVVGTHFFSPANVMRLLEIVRGNKTANDIMATVMQLAKSMHKIAVVSGVCDGFIGNRMVEPYTRQAMFLLEEGALPQQIDRALERFGFAMGPFRMSDLAGNDVSWYIRKRHYVERPATIFSKIADRLCEAGRFGQKTGAGWYSYLPGDRTAHPDPFVEHLVVDYSKEIGIQRRMISDTEIVERCAYALVNEGARLLEEGISLRASDIDVVYLNGYGFPKFRGGPMHYADQIGLYNVVRKIRTFASDSHGDRTFWTPARLLLLLADRGKAFADASEFLEVREHVAEGARS
jgi:3-hydroxyacyl-CoA dehydrogenase